MTQTLAKIARGEKMEFNHEFFDDVIQNSVALVRTRTIPTERPPPVGEVSANFCG